MVYANETDNIAINYSWIYMIGHWWFYRRNMPPLLKRKLGLPQYKRSQGNLKFSQPLVTRCKKYFSPHKKMFVAGGGEYIAWMEKRDASSTDYQKVVRVCGQKVRHCRNYNQKHFICLRFVFTTFYTGSFQVPPEKSHS